MKNENVVLGMKVVPHNKTVLDWGNLESSMAWMNALERNQNYLYVSGWIEEESAWCLSLNSDYNPFDMDDIETDDGDYYNASDFEPFVEYQ